MLVAYRKSDEFLHFVQLIPIRVMKHFFAKMLDWEVLHTHTMGVDQWEKTGTLTTTRPKPKGVSIGTALILFQFIIDCSLIALVDIYIPYGGTTTFMQFMCNLISF